MVRPVSPAGRRRGERGAEPAGGRLRLPPDVHIFTSTKLPWLALPEGARAVPEHYSSKALWPAESLARRRLFGR